MLNFLNPAVLFGLVAALIPLLIHLLNRRKIRRIEFSTIQFLKQLEKKQVRNLRIRQIILLILRTLIILFLVLAFARPTLQTQKGLFAQRSPIEAVIILDNSLSLNEVRFTTTLLDDFRERFNSLEQLFREGDRITIIQATFPTEILIDREYFPGDIWERVNKRIQSNYLKSNIPAALSMAANRLQESPFFNREIYLISDFQNPAGEISEQLNLVEQQGIKLFLLPLYHQNPENVSIDSLEIVNRLIEVNLPLQLQTWLYNHHPDKSMTTLGSVILNDTRVAQTNIHLEKSRSTIVPFQITLATKGFVKGVVEIEEDANVADNRYYFNFYVPEKLKILHLNPSGTARGFLPLILKPAVDRGLVSHEVQAFDNWSQLNFMDYDFLIVENISSLPEAFGHRLSAFIRAGGGVLLLPPENGDISSFNELLQTLAIGRITGQKGERAQKSEFVSFEKIDWQHPLFEGLLENKSASTRPIEVYSYYQLKTGPNLTSLIRLADGNPFLLMKESGAGLIYLMTAPLNTDWTELPIKGFVVPLLYRMIYFAGVNRVQDRQMVHVGERFSIAFSGLEAPLNFSLQLPGGEMVKLQPRMKGNQIFLQTPVLEIPGNYAIFHNEKMVSLFSVNIWKEESRITPITGAMVAERFPGGTVLDEPAQIVEMVQKLRFGKELWKYALFIALALLLVEMVIARTSSVKQFQREQSREQVAA